jgi:hypothetical protein
MENYRGKQGREQNKKEERLGLRGRPRYEQLYALSMVSVRVCIIEAETFIQYVSPESFLGRYPTCSNTSLRASDR